MKRFLAGLAVVASLTGGVRQAAANLLVNGGFETSEVIETHLPSTTGHWAADGGTILAPENGIVPVEGDQMLRFDFTGFGTASGRISDQWQLIDVTSLSSVIAGGLVTATASAQFNRVAGGSQTDTQFGITLAAINGNPSEFDDYQPNLVPFLASTHNSVFTDGHASSWETATANLTLPSNTTYLAVDLLAFENIYANSTSPEFDGHYVDNAVVSLTVIPEPSTLLVWSLLAGFGIGYGWYRRVTPGTPASQHRAMSAR